MMSCCKPRIRASSRRTKIDSSLSMRRKSRGEDRLRNCDWTTQQAWSSHHMRDRCSLRPPATHSMLCRMRIGMSLA